MIQSQDMSGNGYMAHQDVLSLPHTMAENGRSKSELGFSLPTPDDSPPRPNEGQSVHSLKVDLHLLTLDETTALFRTKVQDARRDTQQLAGSEEVSEVVKPKLTLDLGNSRVSRLPEAVVDLIKEEVERLSLSNNQIWHIPLRFSECSHLRYLNIRSNVFRELPRGIYKLPLLEILDISRNKVRRITKDIRHLTSLRVLSLVHNRIDDLPVELCEMSKLRIVKIAENPLRGKLKSVIESKEKELDLVYSTATDNEREQAVTAEIKRHLREQQSSAQPSETESAMTPDDQPTDTPKPIKRVMSSRFPVVPSSSSMDATSDLIKSSPNQSKPPPIPTRSHHRVISGQMNPVRKQNASASTGVNERNRSNSEGTSVQNTTGARTKRMGILRKERSDLDAIDETKVFRQSHLRGFSHGSALRRNGSISSPLVGNSSPHSPRIFAGPTTPTAKRLSSLPEGRNGTCLSTPIIEGAKGLLFSLHQVEVQVRGILAVVEGDDAKRSSLDFTFYNASKWLKRLNKTLQRAMMVDPEDAELVAKAQDSVQQYCADCVMAYKHVISQLQDNVKRIVTGVDLMYVHTLMLLLFGSIVEIKNAMKSFGVEIRGHKRQMSSGNTHAIETIPEEFTTPQQLTRMNTNGRGRDGTKPQGRYRSDTTIQLPTLENMPALQPVQPFQPPGSARLPMPMHATNSFLNGGPPSTASSYASGGTFHSFGMRSRSNSGTAYTGTPNSSFSSIANTPRSGEAFNLPPPTNMVNRINPVTGMTEAQEDVFFEKIYMSLTRCYEIALQTIPIAQKHFQKCLENAEESRQPKVVRDLWHLLIHRCKSLQDNGEALQIRLVNMPHTASVYGAVSVSSGRDDPSFWLLCKTFLRNFIELVADMREAKDLHILPTEIVALLRPFQKSSRDTGRLLESSPWRHLTDGTGSLATPAVFASHGGILHGQVNGHSNAVNGGVSVYPSGIPYHLQSPMYSHSPMTNAPASSLTASAPPTFQPLSSTYHSSVSGSATPVSGHLSATPLSAALGPAAQATIPSTPASAYGDHFFKGDVFQRADSLLSMPQAGSINFLNRR